MTHNEYSTQDTISSYASFTHDKEAISQIFLPLSPVHKDSLEAKVCQKFVKHLRHVPSGHVCVKILASIQYTADMLDCSDAHVSKILVDYGLRAPRRSFPETFLDHVDHSIKREPYEVGAASWSYKELCGHWTKIGDNPFAKAMHHYPQHQQSSIGM